MIVTAFESGNSGCTIAVGLALSGYEVHLFDFDQFPTNIAAIQKTGGIFSSEKVEGFARLRYCGHDLGIALERVNIIYVGGCLQHRAIWKSLKRKTEKRSERGI